jgi:hypothetical protein
MGVFLFIRGWSVASAAFVQRWRYMLMSLCLSGLILFPLVLVTALSVSDLLLERVKMMCVMCKLYMRRHMGGALLSAARLCKHVCVCTVSERACA